MLIGKSVAVVLVMVWILPLLLISCAFGGVQDVETGEPIPGAQVVFEDSEGGTSSTTTDENGFYRFDAVQGDEIPAVGPTTYEISAPGYGTSVENRDILYDDSSERVWEAQNFQLLPGSTCVGEDLSLTEIAVGFGGYGHLQISDFQDRDTFTMTVVERHGDSHWAAVGIDLIHYNQGETGMDLSCYRHMVVRVRGEKGGEKFWVGLRGAPKEFYYDEGLTTQWQNIAFDMPRIWDVEERREANRVGFEIGPKWTDNTFGTIIHVDGISFTKGD